MGYPIFLRYGFLRAKALWKRNKQKQIAEED